MRSSTSVVLAVLLLSAGCTANESKTTAEQAVPEFHARYNASRFDLIYQTADDRFRKAAPKNEYDAFMSAVRRKLGRVKSSDLQTWTVFVGTSGTKVTLVYNTQFEQGRASEQFVYLNGSNGTKLLGYNVNSALLVTK